MSCNSPTSPEGCGSPTSSCSTWESGMKSESRRSRETRVGSEDGVNGRWRMGSILNNSSPIEGSSLLVVLSEVRYENGPAGRQTPRRTGAIREFAMCISSGMAIISMDWNTLVHLFCCCIANLKKRNIRPLNNVPKVPENPAFLTIINNFLPIIDDWSAIGCYFRPWNFNVSLKS